MNNGWNELMKRQGRDDARVGLASMAGRLSRAEERLVYQAAYDREANRLRAEQSEAEAAQRRNREAQEAVRQAEKALTAQTDEDRAAGCQRIEDFVAAEMEKGYHRPGDTKPVPSAPADTGERLRDHGDRLHLLETRDVPARGEVVTVRERLEKAEERILALEVDARTSSELYAKLRASRGKQVEALEKEVAKLRAATGGDA